MARLSSKPHGGSLPERLALCCSAASAARPCSTSTDRAIPETDSESPGGRHGANHRPSLRGCGLTPRTHCPKEATDMKRPTILATLATALAASVAATAVPAQAAVSSASIDDLTATLNLNGADDNVTVSVVAGLLVHGQTTGGLNSGSDWDSEEDGDQTVPADGTRTVIVNAGDGNDAITVLAKSTGLADAELASSGLNGDGGDDVLTGPDSNDTLIGGEGNDRLVAGKGDDVMNGGGGNDTLVWNQGDGSDRANGDAGNDVAEVNGAPTLGDVFTLEPVAGGAVRLRRTNLGQFTFDAATERFEVNGLGGNDSITANDGVGALTSLSVDGGAGADTKIGRAHV